MTARLNPYLNFKDSARAAMTFYQSVFGGELTVSSFGDFHMEVGEAEKNLVMHAQLLAPNGFCLMGADTPSHMTYTPAAGFSVSLSGSGAEEEAALKGYWEKLAAGATIGMPLEKAPWGDTFGMLTDKFGISWLVNIGGTPQ